MKFSYQLYMKHVNACYEIQYYCRYGQILFNVLYTHWPEIANDIRGTDKDPFYCEKDNEIIMKFFEELAKYEN